MLETLSQLGPVATALTAAVAAVVGLSSLRQRNRADRREQWWERARWAIDLSLDENDARREVGFAVLAVLAESELARPEELEILKAAGAWVLDTGHAPGDTGSVRGEEGDDERG